MAPLSPWLAFRKYAITATLLGITLFSNQLLIAQTEEPTATEQLDYQWEQVFYGKLNNERKLLYTHSFARSQISFADIDGDHDDDLIIGKADGQLAFFENVAKKGFPEYELRTEALTALHEESDVDGNLVMKEKLINVRANASPTFVDIDADGDLDLFIGSKDGTIFYYHNSGNPLLPLFELRDPAYMMLRPGTNTVPRFKDINNDRAPDLIVGTHSGKVYLYKNAGVQLRPFFCNEAHVQPTGNEDPTCRYPRELIGDIAPEVDASPTLVDWNYDGLWDIAVGKASGRMSFYYNKGNPFQPKWELESDRFLYIDAGGYAAPKFYDLSGDGFSELLIGTSTSKIVYYENREILQRGLNRLTDVDLSEIDWKEDHSVIIQNVCQQLEDCLTPLAAAFNIPETVEITQEAYAAYIIRPPAFSSRIDDPSDPSDPPFSTDMANRNRLWMATRNFLNFGHLLNNDQRSTVTSGDWDEDGDLDLLLGSASGALYAYENVGTTREPNWRRLRNPIFDANHRTHSAPVLIDIDDDEDLDILVGNHSGKLELILNEGDDDRPDWKINNLAYADIDVGTGSIPSFLDIDDDDDYDLFVGNSRGRIIFYLNMGDDKNPRFQRKSTRFANLIEDQNLAPTFFPWNDDEALDLVLGRREGGLSLISNRHQEGTPLTQGWVLEEDHWLPFETFGYSAPHAADFDQDQKQDLLIGDIGGNLLVWLNKGFTKIEEPPEEATVEQVSNSIELEAPPDVPPEEVPLIEDEELPPEAPPIEEVDLPYDPVYVYVTDQFLPPGRHRRIVPAFYDMDVDGDLDLIIGTKRGELLHYSNEGSLTQPQWTLMTNRFLDFNGGRNATPFFADFDNDEDMDFLVGTSRGILYFWENQGTPDFPEFVPNPTLLQGVTGGINSRPIFIDDDNNNLMDLLIGNFKGELVLYLQKLEGTQRKFRLTERQYLGIDFGIGTAPTMADLNNDKAQELVIGTDEGLLIAFNRVPIQKPTDWGWQKLDYLDNLTPAPPLSSFPTFADIDQDNDLDLFIGGEKGQLYFYRNDGSPQAEGALSQGG